MTPAAPRATGGAVAVLLHDAIDYAGLFPPAALSMAAAVGNYAKYLASADAWALGRFVVPAAKLGELAAAAEDAWGRGSAPWRVSALLSDVRELQLVDAFNAAHPQAAVDSVEIKAVSTDAVASLANHLPRGITAYVEIPVEHDPDMLVHAIGDAGIRAKIRTGGITPDAFPSPRAVVRFLASCVRRGVPFKATAGLHHPIRASYRLTYAADAASAPMYGFLNLFLATALLQGGADEALAAALLLEERADAFRIDADAITWHTHRFDRAALTTLRGELAGFGSCSFREPIDDLTTLGYL